jgi:hypothetical protein
MAQNASATYPLAGLGAWVQVNPTPELAFAIGAQNATNISGETIEFDDFGDGPWTRFGYVQWTPSFHGLGSGTYSLLVYDQPAVPEQPAASTGRSPSNFSKPLPPSGRCRKAAIAIRKRSRIGASAYA